MRAASLLHTKSPASARNHLAIPPSTAMENVHRVHGRECERSVSGAENGEERVKNTGAGAERAFKKVPECERSVSGAERERSVERHELPVQIPLQPPSHRR